MNRKGIILMFIKQIKSFNLGYEIVYLFYECDS